MTVIAGKYEVIRSLGEGGYGQVYLVRHTDLGVEYALKILHRYLCEDEKFIERFKREASILQRFVHPGSVNLRDFGKTDDGLYYLAMDFAAGESLLDLLAREGRLAPREALDMTMQLLETLEAAHRAGIIHRDIKPDNLMVSEPINGRRMVRVLDFGIAKLREQMVTSTKTMEGASIGTPQYMSPEAAGGEKNLDHRIDIYSAGVLLYEMITGEVPFSGESVVQTLLMHLTQVPPPFPKDLGVSESLDLVVRKALAKLPKDRFRAAGEFAEACRCERDKLPELCPLNGASRTKRSVSAAVRPPTGVKPVKILCLDDNEMILNILSHLLEREGYQVFTATSGATIHDYLFNEQVQLLISDVQMPGLPGNKVCKLLKESVKDLKIVLFSNIDERELKRLSAESNADDWMSKNTKPEQWLQKVQSLIGPPLRPL